MKKIFVISLGCPKNLSDTEEMLGALTADGHELVFSEGEADTILINTCAFLKSARDEAKAEIKRAVSLKKKGGIKHIFVAGCLPQKERKTISSEFPQVDSFLGIEGIGKISSLFKRPGHCLTAAPKEIHAPEYKLQLTAPHSAYLKISDGCDNRCAYCLIPSIRGVMRSKPIEEVVAEAKALAASGVKEISLTAQDTTAYGKDLYGRPSLLPLLKELVKIKGVHWFRIMYVYPETIDEPLLKFIAKNKKIAGYLDMPLQHISDSVLKAMRRRADSAEIREKLTLIKKLTPDMSVRTNFIVGFPGETEADFKELMDFVKTAEFNNVGVFAYSKEKGTAAAEMKKQVSEKVKNMRVAELISAQSKVIDKINKRIKGKIFEVIMDSPHRGRSAWDSPDIDGYIEVSSPKPLKAGDIVKVKITSARGYMRKAEVVK
ncbi:ribosomal protein S12 methylthiotransferase [Parelusimicrobium proximum]|uniref:30S ribosomal protein S12 methylthiotransferase RimO n=1 Tax=Parelusimicrobium proximum TaxID=3228953 RepID=UPI003D168971